VLHNKLLFAGVGVIALLLVVSLIVVRASLAKERRSRRQAEVASAKSQHVTRFLEDMLQGVGPSDALFLWTPSSSKIFLLMPRLGQR
jgi:eukaryotic-like serine/threonine-protein kinase